MNDDMRQAPLENPEKDTSHPVDRAGPVGPTDPIATRRLATRPGAELLATRRSQRLLS
jgi:hypothetical protein